MKAFLYKAGFFLLLVLILSQTACSDQEDIIPYVPVSFPVNLNIANEMKVSGNSFKYEFEGYGGVILYCEYYDPFSPANSIYHAYDAACTLEISKDCSLENDGSTVTATCPCCSSSFNLLGGFPVSGDASIPLKQYNVSVLGDMAQVYN